MNSSSGSATLPRCFRFSGPRTPEPTCDNDEAAPPSPPRPRLKLKRRNITAPTQQFLASVAAADVPIPSIEEADLEDDLDMFGTDDFAPEEDGNMLLHARVCQSTYLPPKTPAPFFVPLLTPSRDPDWSIGSVVSSSIESSPEYDEPSSRPSTSRSTLTSTSLFSRLSHWLDRDECAPADGEAIEQESLVSDLDVVRAGEGQQAAAQRRKAPWTRAMDDHLWSTYALYLQDPKVTPFRMGKSCIPPHGVLLRVAREAKRSWKGSKPYRRGDGETSESSTPTSDSTAVFMQWPHTSSATRNHLRHLCRLKALAQAKKESFFSPSPTPFTEAAARHWNRRATPARISLPSLSSWDMAMSLSISAADSMQLEGPLAQLTASTAAEAFPALPTAIRAQEPFLIPLPCPSLPPSCRLPNVFGGEGLFAAQQKRLGSPFNKVQGDGPTLSTSLGSTTGMGASMWRKRGMTLDHGPRTLLHSPVRLSRTTQKRRNTQSGGIHRMRPSIVTATWLDPNLANAASAVAAAVELSSTDTTPSDGPFGPQAPAHAAHLLSSISISNVGGRADPNTLPPRLGSPLLVAPSSHSFPHRVHRLGDGSLDLAMLGRPFVTLQADSTAAAPSRNTPLEDRLAYLDQRLKEIRNREPRRSPV